MTYITKKEVDEAMGIVKALRQQNNGPIFNRDNVRWDMRLRGASQAAYDPGTQEIFLSQLERGAEFFGKFGELALLSIAPDKTAAIEHAVYDFPERKMYGHSTVMADNRPVQFYNESASSYERFSDAMHNTIGTLKEIASDRKFIQDYVEARREYRRAKECYGREGDVETYLNQRIEHDAERAMDMLMRGFDFEANKGDFLKKETGRLKEETELYTQFREAYDKAEEMGMLKSDFLPLLGESYQPTAHPDVYWKNITGKAGGVNYLDADFSNKKTPLREGGYEAAHNVMANLSEQISGALERTQELKTAREQNRQHQIQQPAEKGFFGKLLDLVTSFGAKAAAVVAAVAGIGTSEAKAEAAPEAAKPARAAHTHVAQATEITTVEMTVLVPTRITLTSVKQAMAVTEISQNITNGRA